MNAHKLLYGSTAWVYISCYLVTLFLPYLATSQNSVSVAVKGPEPGIHCPRHRQLNQALPAYYTVRFGVGYRVGCPPFSLNSLTLCGCIIAITEGILLQELSTGNEYSFSPFLLFKKKPYPLEILSKN